jgi:hypothetical protein
MASLMVGALALRARNKPEWATCSFYRDAPSRFIGVIDEFIDPYTRFWTHIEIANRPRLRPTCE